MHTMLRLLSGGLLAASLIACATPTAPVDDAVTRPEKPPKPQSENTQTAEIPTDIDTCGAAALSVLIGKSIAAVQMPADKNIRVIGVNTQITQDHRPERMNIKIDEVANITDIYCG